MILPHPLKENIMEAWASKEATLAALTALGFIQTVTDDDVREDDNVFLDSPKEDPFGPVVQVLAYRCRLGYWCVAADLDGFQAPVVWNGPRTDWDTSNPTEDFVKHLDENFPGWR